MYVLKKKKEKDKKMWRAKLAAGQWGSRDNDDNNYGRWLGEFRV